MRKLLLALAILGFAPTAMADTPPARVINAEAYDAAGNPIGSTSGSLNVNVTNPTGLPAGASTATLQTAGNTTLSSIDTALSSVSTAANQASEITYLNDINGKISAFNLNTSGAEYDQGVSLRFASPGGSIPAGVDANPLRVDPTGTTTQPVSADSLPLPTGAATESTLSTLNGKLTTTSNGIKVDGSATTQPISASALPLPTGASTDATLSALSAKLGTLGQKAMAGSAPVVIASDQAPIPVSGTFSATNPSIATNGSAIPASSTQVGGKDNSGNLQPLQLTSTKALIVDASATTQPVSGTFWQATQPVSGTIAVSNLPVTQPVSVASLPLPAGAATSALQSTGNTSLSDIDTKLPALVSSRVPVDGSGVTQPVSGTFWQTTQPVSGTVTVNQGTAGASAWKVDGSAVTQPVSGTFWQATQPVSGTVTANAGTGTFAVSAASLPLPTGASTAAKQPALGTAGTASTDVITVQGIASMTALKVDGSAVTQPVSGTFWQSTQPVSAASLPLPAGAATSALQTTGNTSLSDIDTKTATLVSGRVPVDGSGVTQPVSGTFWQATQPVSGSVSVSNFPGSQAVTGTFWQSTQPVSLATVPLPSGAATSANQATEISSLSSIAASVAAPQASPVGRSYADSIRNVYSSTTVGTVSWVQVSASTAATMNVVSIFDSCGQVLELGVGALGSEVRKTLIPPGGLYNWPLLIPGGSRISLRAVSATCSKGEFDMTGLN
jgi:hypothetical protein